MLNKTTANVLKVARTLKDPFTVKELVCYGGYSYRKGVVSNVRTSANNLCMKNYFTRRKDKYNKIYYSKTTTAIVKYK